MGIHTNFAQVANLKTESSAWRRAELWFVA